MKHYIQSLTQLTPKILTLTEQRNQHNKLLSDAKDYKEKKREIEEKEIRVTKEKGSNDLHGIFSIECFTS